MGSGFQWYRTYERGYQTSGSHLRFMLRRSSLVECVSVLPGNRCLQNVDFFFLRQYVQPCLLKNPKYTFYTIKSSHINLIQRNAGQLGPRTSRPVSENKSARKRGLVGPYVKTTRTVLLFYNIVQYLYVYDY